MVKFTVPASQAEITSAWLGAVLADSLKSAIDSELEKERIGQDYGFASRLFRCRWEAKGEPQSVVVKIWDLDSKAGNHEVLFYQAFPNPGVRIPICYYSASDEKTGQAVLVLEDLTEAVQGDVLQLLDLDRAQAVARSLAGLHAAWLDKAQLNEFGWLPDVSIWEMDSDWFRSRRAEFLQRFGDRLSGLGRRLLDRLQLAPEVANRRLASAPKTLLHGDFHLDNMLFEVNGTPVFLDWTRPQSGPLALNLAVLLFAMTPLDNFDSVLEAYLQAFNLQVHPPLAREAVERQLGGALLRQFAIGTLGIARWQPALPRAVQMIEANLQSLDHTLDFWRDRDPALFSFLDNGTTGI